MSLEKLYQEQKELQKIVKDLCIKIETVQNKNLQLKLKAELDEAENSLMRVKEQLKYENENPKNQNGLTEYVPPKENVIVVSTDEDVMEDALEEDTDGFVEDEPEESEEMIESEEDEEFISVYPVIRDAEEANGINYGDLFNRYEDAKEQGDTELMQNLFRVTAKGADRGIGEAVHYLGRMYNSESNSRQCRKGIELIIRAANEYQIRDSLWWAVWFYKNNSEWDIADKYLERFERSFPEELSMEEIGSLMKTANILKQTYSDYRNAYKFYEIIIADLKKKKKWHPQNSKYEKEILMNDVICGINIGEIAEKPEILEPLLRPIVDTSEVARNYVGGAYADTGYISAAIPYLVRNEGNRYAQKQLLIIYKKLTDWRERNALEKILNQWAENHVKNNKNEQALEIYTQIRTRYVEEKNDLKMFVYTDKLFHASPEKNAGGYYWLYRDWLTDNKRKDPYNVIRFLEEASEENVSLVDMELGDIYTRGRVIPRDYKKALKYYIKAEYTVENCKNGISGAKYDYQVVKRCIKEAKDNIYYEEQYELALQNLNTEKFSEAFEVMLRLAKYQFGPALYQVAKIYDSGFKVNTKNIDDETMLNYYIAAAEWGYEPAIEDLIMIYKKGYRRFVKDLDEANKWEKRLNSRKKFLWD